MQLPTTISGQIQHSGNSYHQDTVVTNNNDRSNKKSFLSNCSIALTLFAALCIIIQVSQKHK